MVGLPTLPFNSTGSGFFDAATLKSINVDPAFANTVDNAGETLIPPKLIDFANTFSGDIKETHGINTLVFVRSKGQASSLFITLDKNATRYVDAAGRPSSEGYTIDVSASGITITGASPLGAWWGTRTLLQQLTLGDGKIPYGSGSDTPGWGVRGVMLDAGRHYYPPDFIIDICSYMSFFKQNTLHLHLSDNLVNPGWYSHDQLMSLYARFRLWSDSQAVAGLNKHSNESYTQGQFETIQTSCAKRGVTIIPEIEAPGHALVFTQWKPQIGLNDLTLLDISNSETIPTMQAVWGTFLSWFHSKTVHIGADEYTGSSQDYTKFVNAMSSYITKTSGKAIRIWGTFTPNEDNGFPDKTVSVQHWASFEANPLTAFIQQNYSVVNSDDWMYCVGKGSTSYPQTLDPAKTFSVPAGGAWYPWVFDTKNPSNNPAPSDKRILGAIAALWNDYGPSSSTYTEAYYTWRRGIPAVADKQWNGDVTQSEYESIFNKLHAAIPSQNLDRSIPSKSSSIIHYKLSQPEANAAPISALAVGDIPDAAYNTSGVISDAAAPTDVALLKGRRSLGRRSGAKVSDISGNGYDGSASCDLNANGTLPLNKDCQLLTPFRSKGRDYSMKITFRLFDVAKYSAARFLGGQDSFLYVYPDVGLRSTNGYFYGTGKQVTLGKWVTIVVRGQGLQTFIKIDDDDEIEIQATVMKFLDGESFTAGYGIEAPVKQFAGNGCGFSGELAEFELKSLD